MVNIATHCAPKTSARNTHICWLKLIQMLEMLLFHMPRGATNVVVTDTFSKTGDHLTKHQSLLGPNQIPVHMSLFDC